MTRKIVAFGVLLLLCIAQLRSAQALTVTIGFGDFYSGLSSSGRWIDNPNYGQCWTPNGVDASWRPYSNGRWVDSNDGWVWVSNESWGLQTYHYGRWIYTDNGWCWIPGSVWAPAWVNWYVGPSYIGWSPCGPQGYATLQPQYCNFVPCASFLSVNVGQSFVPYARNASIIGSTNYLNNLNMSGSRVINRGPSVSLIQGATHHAVPRYNLLDSKANANRLNGNNLYVYRPVVRPVSGHSTPLLTKESKGQVWLGTHAVTVHPVAPAGASHPALKPAASHPATKPVVTNPALKPAVTNPALKPAASHPALKPAAAHPATKPAAYHAGTKPAASHPAPQTHPAPQPRPAPQTHTGPQPHPAPHPAQSPEHK